MGQITSLWIKLSLRQRVTLLATVALVILGLYGFVVWQKERDFSVLFENVAPEEAGQIVNRLKESGIEVRLRDGGTRILVPSASVAEQRLSLAAQGLPQTGRIGFEIFDKTQFGATDFTEQVNYQRAVEGEMERSLTTIQEIERARVHITFAKDSVFLENQKPAKASVILKLRMGAKLDARQVQAITNLVASAVEGLAPDQVSVLDTHGNLLSQIRAALSADGDQPPEAILQFRKHIEDDFQRKLLTTLDPLLGHGRYRTSVSVDLDMTSGTESSEDFDPDRSVMTSTQKQEDVSGSSRSGGVPGTASNLPRGASQARAGSGGIVRRSESVAFQTSRTVRSTKVPQGVLKRVSVSVLLDQRLRWEGTGADAKRVLEAPSSETLDGIRQLVTGAIGLSDERGDQLVVESLPFESTISEPPPGVVEAAPAAPATGLDLNALLSFLPKDVPLWVWAAIAGGVVLLLLLAAFFLWRKKRNRKRIQTSVLPSVGAARGNTPAISEAAMAAALAGGGEDLQTLIQRQQEMLREKENAAVASLKQAKLGRTQVEVLSQHLTELVKSDGQGVAQVLRTWLTEDR